MRTLLLAALMAVTPLAAIFSQPAFLPSKAAHATAEDHIIVKFRSGSAAPNLAGLALNELASALSLPAGAELSEDHFKIAERTLRKSSGTPDLSRFFYVRVPATTSAENLVRQLSGHPLVEYAELDHIGSGGATTPTDPNFSSQWHHKNPNRSGSFQPDIHSTEAWDFTTGSTNVIVAVLDTGLAYTLNEFTNRVVPGYDFANNDTDPVDDHGHGTAVAGTIAANANNNTLVAGVDWKCRIMPLKVLDANNIGFYSWWASAIDWAVSNGCKVINLSAGGSSSDITLTRAITNAIARGVIFVTITHNDGVGTIRFPGNLTNCITVGATDQQDRRTGFSNFGSQIDLVAPGTNIYTISTGGGLTYWWGTSFSAPQVSGVAALLCSLRPSLTHYQVADLLSAGAEDRVGDASDTAGWDQYYGWGRLNAYNTLLLARTSPRASTTNGQATLWWASPPNASNRQPYRVSFAPSATGPWTTAGLSNFTYTSTNTTWRGTLTPSNQFFRVQIRP